MRVQVQLRIVAEDDSVISDDTELLLLDKTDDRLEALGLSLAEAKTLLAGVQQRLVTAQAASYAARHRDCPVCGRPRRSKGPYPILFRTAFGVVPLSSPRFHRCRCQPAQPKTFSPLTALFTEHTAPELLYLETRWASLVSYGLTADLLQDILPIGRGANASTLRSHLHRVAARHEADLGAERPSVIEGGSTELREPDLAEGPHLVGLDGGYVRNWHDKHKKFEVIVGKSVPEDRASRYFGLVQTHDDKPKRRLFEVLQAQGLPRAQDLTFLTDGGDSVRGFVADLSPGAAHHLDWFHITMRLTGLDRYARGLGHHNPGEAAALQSRLARIKWRLWHGDAGEALARAHKLAADVAALDSAYPNLPRFATAAAGLATYIQNNAAALPNYGERYRTGEAISTAFVESTVNLVVAKRFAKKQQMQWSKQGAHLLLQTRTRTLDGTLRDLFAKWYPAMAVNDNEVPIHAAA
ncbi:MAG TPA: ISKra4 family transposase [Acetobacteraceae bacterium]